MNRNASFWRVVLAVAVMTAAGEVRAQVRINEVMADNGGSVIAPGGTTPDYIELFNTNVSAVSIAGWKISQELNSTNAAVFTFPAGTTIGGTNYLMLWLDALTNGPGPGLHITSFTLSANGEAVSLYNAGGILQDVVAFGFQILDKPIVRFPNGTGKWTLGSPTPGATNKSITLGTQRALRINEWLPTNSLGVDKDRLEIYNPPTNGPVSFGGSNGVLITTTRTRIE